MSNTNTTTLECNFCLSPRNSFFSYVAYYWLFFIGTAILFYAVGKTIGTYNRNTREFKLKDFLRYCKNRYSSRITGSVASLISKNPWLQSLCYFLICISPFLNLPIYVLISGNNFWSNLGQAILSSLQFFVLVMVLGTIGIKQSLYKIYVDKFIDSEEARILIIYQVYKALYAAFTAFLIQILTMIGNDFECVSTANPEIMYFFFRNVTIIILAFDRIRFFWLESQIMKDYKEHKKLDHIKKAYQQISSRSLAIRNEMIMQVRNTNSTEQGLLGEITELLTIRTQEMLGLMSQRLIIEEERGGQYIIRNQGDNVIYCKLFLGYSFLVSCTNLLVGTVSYFNTYFETSQENCFFFYTVKWNLVASYTIQAWFIHRLMSERVTIGKFKNQDVALPQKLSDDSLFRTSNEFQFFSETGHDLSHRLD